MFKTRTLKGHETRQRIFQTALALFRKQGFETTTMRDVAAAAELSLGAAYHYFPSKEAIVLAYYDEVQDEHARRVEEAIQRGLKLRETLAAVFHAKLDILSDDRPLMGALLRYTGDPSHPLSFLGPGTRDLQAKSAARPDSHALFDAGYLIESYKQAAHLHRRAAPAMDGYALVKQAITLSGANPEMEFAASLMTSGAAAEAHRRRAEVGAATGSLLARNLQNAK